MINITILGNLTADATVRQTQGEYKAISFSLAVNEKRQNDEQAVTFFNCTLWSKSDKIAQYLTKGKKVLALLDWFEITEKNGKTYTNFRVRNVNPFLESKKEEPTPQQNKNPFLDDDDDLQF